MNGLTSAQVAKKQTQFGFNEIVEKKESLLKKLFLFFWGPIPWMIELAALLSGLLERWPDFILITALLLINALLGFFHEYQADNAIAALKQKLALQTRVLRDGSWIDLPAKELVPGDIVELKLGNIIPADVKLIDGDYLSVDQAALTGESLPVDKKQGDTAYSGTTIKLGEMIGEVTETGMHTFFGKTAKLIESAETVSHFQKAILNIGRFLIITTLFIAGVILVDSLFHTNTGLAETAIFILVLIVAGIPVALPAVMSVTMAIGAHKMASMKAIVSKLLAIEELAGMDILCSDKTGTLTKNQLTLGECAAEDDSMLLAAALACNQASPDAIDGAILDAYPNRDELSNYQIEKFTPFDPVHKRTEAKVSGPSGSFSVTKGAPQVIFDLTQHIDNQGLVEKFAAKGYRTLGVAKNEGGTWKFLGLIPLFDPPRDDTKETIETVQKMGVQVKMVTGDHESIAKEIAGKVGLGQHIIPIKEVSDTPEKYDGFAEVYPEHKFGIVKKFQEHKHTVGMTGDGVNDAPALKQADIGIAVSGATDAARASADLILTEPGLIVIGRAIEEARRIFGRLKSYAMYRISETCRLLLFLLLAVLTFDHQPLSAIMIILIALLNDIPIMLIAYDHMVVDKSPTQWDMKEMLTLAVGLAVVGVISTFGLYWIGKFVWMLPHAKCSTLAFMGILCGGNLTIYLTRNRGFFLMRPFPEKKFFLATLFSQIVGTLLSVYGLGTDDFRGLGWEIALQAWIYIALWFGICAIAKRLLLLIPHEKIAFTKKKIMG